MTIHYTPMTWYVIRNGTKYSVLYEYDSIPLGYKMIGVKYDSFTKAERAVQNLQNTSPQQSIRGENMTAFRKSLRDRTHAGEFDIHLEYNSDGNYWYAWTKTIDVVKDVDAEECLRKLANLIQNQIDDLRGTNQ